MLKTASNDMRDCPEIIEGVVPNFYRDEPPPSKKMLRKNTSSTTQTMSFKLELKQCEVGCVLQVRLIPKLI